VNDADPAVLDRNRQARLGDGVQAALAIGTFSRYCASAGADVGLIRQHVGVPRHEQHVVERSEPARPDSD
jgi:hypothetical protein